MRLPKREGTWLVAAVIFAALVLRVYTVIISSMYVPVTSDEAITILQAKDFLRGNFGFFVWAQPYQFPLETYLTAPFVPFLPRNGFGARFVSFLISIATFVVVLMALRKTGSIRQNWPAVALVLFPSAYLMMIQFGYPIPHYTSSFLLWWIAILTALHVRGDGASPRDLAVVMVCGLFCGLAFTNNMTAISVVMPVAVVVCWPVSWLSAVKKTAAFAVGAFAGLLPYVAGIWVHPEAHAPVSGTRHVSDALGYIWSPLLSNVLPRTMGAGPGLFPDSHRTLEYGEWMVPVLKWFFVLMLLYATVLSVWRIIEQVLEKKWPALTANEIFVGAAWLGLICFAFSRRADSSSYRYISTVAWIFPFIVAYVYNALPRRLRGLLGLAVVFMIFFNIVTVVKLTSKWKDPDYGSDIVNAPDLKPALEFLRQKEIRHCYASHWAAYRISFLADEEIICSQPYNERFPGWPVPYKSAVDAATNTAYVLTKKIRFLKPDKFEEHLKKMRVQCDIEETGDFRVYHNFALAYDKGDAVQTSSIKISADNNNGDAMKMLDGRQDSFWRTDRLQEQGMTVQAELDQARNIHLIELYYGHSGKDHPDRMVLECLTPAGWQEIQFKMFDKTDKFRFENNHPVYGYPGLQTLYFDPVMMQAFRLTIEKPSPSWAWTITEMKIFEQN